MTDLTLAAEAIIAEKHLIKSTLDLYKTATLIKKKDGTVDYIELIYNGETIRISDTLYDNYAYTIFTVICSLEEKDIIDEEIKQGCKEYYDTCKKNFKDVKLKERSKSCN